MGNKGPLTDANFARLKAELDDFARAKEIKNKRCSGSLRQHRKPRRGRETFSHLPSGVRQVAEEKYAAYKLKHAEKLARLSGLDKVRFLGSLAGCAAAHALHPGSLSKFNPKRTVALMNRAKSIRTRLGMRQAKPSWGRGPEQYRGKRLHEVIEMQVAQLQRDQGKEPVAESGSTDMTGV